MVTCKPNCKPQCKPQSHFHVHKDKYLFGGILMTGLLATAQWIVLKAILLKIIVSAFAAVGLYGLVEHINAIVPGNMSASVMQVENVEVEATPGGPQEENLYRTSVK